MRKEHKGHLNGFNTWQALTFCPKLLYFLLITYLESTKLQKAHQLWRGWIYIGNYIYALFLLKAISAFGCGLLASGVGIGYWSVALQISVTIHFLSSFCICNFSCRSFPGRRFTLEVCLLFWAEGFFMGNCWNRVQDWVAHIDHLMNNMRSEAWIASHVREK